ncbi:MAG: ParB/RepB/Spo0J family partition protein [Halanaerobiales bacterium]
MDLPFLGKNKKNRVEKIKIDKILPNPHQPRTDFSEENLKKLAESIDNFGIIQPLIVKEGKEGYQLIAGERRLRAAKMIDLKEVPAIVNNYKEEEVAEISLVENIQRQDLNFLDEALAYYSIMNKFDLSQTELAEKVGKSQSTIANKLRILRLPESILALIRKYELSERHARALLKIEDNKKQKELIKEIKNKDLSVRSLNRRINRYLKEEKETKQVKTYYKDTRLLKNTLNSAIEQIRKAGIEVNVIKEDKEDFIRYDIKIVKKKDGN